jgi:hypothetical protein
MALSLFTPAKKPGVIIINKRLSHSTGFVFGHTDFQMQHPASQNWGQLSNARWF